MEIFLVISKLRVFEIQMEKYVHEICYRLSRYDGGGGGETGRLDRIIINSELKLTKKYRVQDPPAQ